MPLLPALLLLGHLTAAPDGEAVIRAAYAKYEGKWFRTMTFVQKTTFPKTGVVETWYEAMQVPGTLRIDRAPASAGRGMIFRNDTLYAIQNGEVRPGRAYVHSMLVMLVDIHALPPERTIAKMRGLGYDLSKTHETTFKGKPVIVVGALAGDTTSKQFWMEKDRLLLARLIEGPMDAHFGGYQKEGEAWVEREILIHQGGVLTQIEEYTQVKTGVTHEPGLFDPAKYFVPKWIGDGRELWPKS